MSQTSLIERLGMPAGLAAAAVAYFTFVDGPSRDAVAAAKSEMVQRQQYIAEADLLKPQIQDAESKLAEAKAHVEKWRTGAPGGNDVSPLYRALHKALRKGGASILRFEPQPAVSLVTLKQVPVAITLVGSHESIHRALVAIEDMDVTIWVRDARLARAGEDDKKVQFEAKLVIFAEQKENSN